MTDARALRENRAAEPRTVQTYLDETPMWRDGTTLAVTPMTRMQWTIWWLAAAGKFFEGMVVFMTGVALPLIAKEFALGGTGHGVVGAAPLFGILVGALALGGLADTLGRKTMFVAGMLLFILFLVLVSLSPSYVLLVAALFGMGVALGGDYPIAHMVISESIPSRNRGRLVLGAFAFQALGALAGTAVGYGILVADPALEAWRWMYASAIIPAGVVVVGRFFVTESPHWLLARGHVARAEREVARLLRRRPPYPTAIALVDPDTEASRDARPTASFAALFSRRNRRATILASVPWFLQDLGTYGIGIFTPTILAAALGEQSGSARNLADLIHNDMLAAEGAALIDVLLIVGIAVAVLLADRVGRIWLQIIGFVGCAAGLFLASLSVGLAGEAQITLVFAGFMLFNFMTNMGPNAQTYLLAGEVFPTGVRGKGAGFAAAAAKVGAVLTAFLFPLLLDEIGTALLLYGLIATSLLGAVVTWLWRIETRGVSLEHVGRAPAEPEPGAVVMPEPAASS